MNTPRLNIQNMLALALASLLAASTAAQAGHRGYAVTGQANVRVWVEGGDVFADYADVAIWLRPERDCYTTLFMVDTDGYMHVLYPNSPYDDTWLYGGRSYCYRACDLGLDRLDGAGIAYVFAVGSPVAFDYSYYGAGVFVGGFGFRVYGDPFVACRDFYLTLLPASCRFDFVGVSYARFYVRHWARYPSYLCYGGPGIHVYVGDGCRACSDVYVSYRESCARPWDVFQPAPRFKQQYESGRVYRGYDDDHARAYSRESRVERARRDVEPRSRTTATWAVRASEKLAKSSEKIAKSSEKIAKSSEKFAKERVVSTSSARARASVDKGEVAALGRTHTVHSGRADTAPRREVTTTKRASEQSARGKGTSKKVRQAR